MHPDLVLSDYTTFVSIYRTLLMVKLISKETYKNHLSQFFCSKITEVLQRNYSFLENGRR